MSELRKETPEEREEGWECLNDQDAEWCMSVIRQKQAEKEFWKAYYKKALDSVNATCDESIGRMEMFLHRYFDSVPHKATKTQENYPLPSGKLVFKRQDPEFERDDEMIITFLKENGGGKYIKVKESLDWDGLKKSVTVVGEIVADETGTIIPGIKAVERPDVFKVELKKEG